MRYDPPQRITRRKRNALKKPRNRKKPNFKLLFCLFAASVILSGIVSFTVQTPALLVREVQIRGVSLTDKAEVERAAKAALGHNIMTLRTSPIVQEISRCHEVADVEMGRQLPDKVWVRVRERKPVAVVANRGNYCMLQGDCLAFHKTCGSVRGVPTVRVARCACIKEGLVCKAPDVITALEVLKTARGNGLHVAKISVDPLGDICLNMEGGYYVKLGQPDEVARKMSVLRTTLTCRPSIAREAAYIDVSYPGAPVWKPKLVAVAAG